MWDEVFGGIPMPTYNVGDKVRIVDHPVEMVFYWNESMNEYCGKECTIRRVAYSETNEVYAYYIEGSLWMWDETCFVPIEEMSCDFTIEDDELFRLLGMK